MASLPRIGAATRFGLSRISRTLDLAATVPRAWQMTLDAVVRYQLIERTIDRLLTEGVVERVAAVTIEHPATERLLARVLDSLEFERLLVTIAQSEMANRVLDGVLASEQLDRVVTHIAESDQVRVAVTQQGFGLADEVAGELRSRTARADALLERVARSMIRRRPVPPAQASGPGSVT